MANQQSHKNISPEDDSEVLDGDKWVSASPQSRRQLDAGRSLTSERESSPERTSGVLSQRSVRGSRAATQGSHNSMRPVEGEMERMDDGNGGKWVSARALSSEREASQQMQHSSKVMSQRDGSRVASQQGHKSKRDSDDGDTEVMVHGSWVAKKSSSREPAACQRTKDVTVPCGPKKSDQWFMLDTRTSSIAADVFHEIYIKKFTEFCPAGNLDLNIGDVLVSINGLSVTNTTKYEVEQIWQQESRHATQLWLSFK